MERYTLVECISGKSIGKIYKAIDILSDDRDVILKIYPKNLNSTNNRIKCIRNSIDVPRILKAKDIDGVIRIRDYFDVNDSYVIVSDYVDGVTLRDRFPEHCKISCNRMEHLNYTVEMLDILLGVVNVLRSLHAASINHGDIKPENIIIGKDNKATFIDFEFAAFRNEDYIENSGTLIYAAPEKIYNPKHETIDRLKCDIYSLGIVIYLMLNLYHPFNIDSEDAYMDCIAKRQYSYSTIRYEYIFGDRLDTLINAMISIEPKQRPKISDIYDELVQIRAVFAKYQVELSNTAKFDEMEIEPQ